MIEETGYGKINLALRIVGCRNDGYHDIDTIFQSISLCDTIQLEQADTLSLTCSDLSLPCDETNLAYKAYAALRPFYGGKDSVSIHLIKRIPLAAGLAGGSTDCAAVLRGLNRFWQLHLPEEELCRIGARIGADVPFCIGGGTARGTGRGEVLKRLPSLPPWPVLLLHPHTAVHTGRAYSLFDLQPVHVPVDVEAQEAAVRAGSRERVMAALGNTFEELLLPDLPEISRLQQVLRREGLLPLMSGSGPTIFALLPPDWDGNILGRLHRQIGNADIIISTLVTGE